MEIRIDPFDNYAQGGNPVLYLATDVSGVYRSFDKGVSWEMLFYEASLEKNTLARYTTSLAFRPTGTRRIIAGTVEGIYLWRNSNNTWKGAVMPASPNGIADEDGIYPWIGVIRENPHDTTGLEILAGIGDVRDRRFGMSAVLRSTNTSVEPDSFELVPIDNTTSSKEIVYDLDFYEYNDTTYTFVTTNRGIYLSKNMFEAATPESVTFSKISASLDSLRGLVLLPETTASDSVVAFVTRYDPAGSGSHPGGLYRNVDVLRSTTWTKTSSDLNRLENISAKPGSTMNDYEVFVSRKNMSWLGVSVDGSVVQIASKNSNVHNGYRESDIDLRFGSFTVADDGEVYGAWGYGPIKAPAESEPDDTREYAQIFTKSKGLDAAGDSTYQTIGMDEVFSIGLFAFDPDNSNIVFVGTTDNGLLRSMNGGQTWSQRRLRDDSLWTVDYGTGNGTQTVHHVAVRKFADTLMVIASAAVKRNPGINERFGELLKAKWDGGKGDESDWEIIGGGRNVAIGINYRDLPSGAIPAFVFDKVGTNSDSERVYCAVRGEGIFWAKATGDTDDKFVELNLSDVIDEENIANADRKISVYNFSRLMFDPGGNDTLYAARSWPAGGVFKIILNRIAADTVAVDTVIEVIDSRFNKTAQISTNYENVTAEVHSLLVTEDYVFAGASMGSDFSLGYYGGLIRWRKSDPPGEWDWVIGGPTGQADSLISIGGIVEDPEDPGNDFWAVTYRHGLKGVDNYKLMGLYKSTDGGATWAKQAQPQIEANKLKFANGVSMAFVPAGAATHNKLLLITTGNGIWIGTRNLPQQ